MAYSCSAVERAMKVQEVILRAIDGKLTWVQAADILGYSPRTIRRLRRRLQYYGYDGLLDRRRHLPSPSGRRSPRCNAYSRCIASGIRASMSGIFTNSPAGTRRALLLRLREEGSADRRAWRPSTSPAGAIGAVGSRARVSGTPASRRQSPPAGWRCGRNTGSPSSRWSMMRPSACCTSPCTTRRRERRGDHDGLAGGPGALRRPDRSLYRPGALGGAYSDLGSAPIAAGPPRSAAPWRGSASSTSWAIRPRRADAVSAPIAPCRTASSTSSV